MALDGIDAEADDLDAALVELALDARHRAELGGAHRRVVLRVREEHPPRVAQPLVETDAALVVTASKSGASAPMGRGPSCADSPKVESVVTSERRISVRAARRRGTAVRPHCPRWRRRQANSRPCSRRPSRPSRTAAAGPSGRPGAVHDAARGHGHGPRAYARVYNRPRSPARRVHVVWRAHPGQWARPRAPSPAGAVPGIVHAVILIAERRVHRQPAILARHRPMDPPRSPRSSAAAGVGRALDDELFGELSATSRRRRFGTPAFVSSTSRLLLSGTCCPPR